MINARVIMRIWNKRLCNKSVYCKRLTLFSNPKVYLRISCSVTDSYLHYLVRVVCMSTHGVCDFIS